MIWIPKWETSYATFLMSPLSVPTVDEMRRASRSFPWKTGLGVDAMPPRAYSLLSDEALAMMVYLIWMCESWGRWPTSIMAVHVMLLVKPQGGFRPIALLPSIYRVYTKVRIVHVRR